jgi:predicted Rossmann fold nucleotide-binding protein DprA/Smf involved in DNA uptake
MTACDDCLRRADLIAALAGRLQFEFKKRSAPGRVLALPDDDLLEIAPPEVRARYRRFDAPAARARASAARVQTVCRCREAYPARLRDLADPPAVLHVLGDLGAVDLADGVAVVGARRASGYGLEVAHALGRGLSAAGVPVISGLALGIDSAAHQGALSAGKSLAVGLASRIETCGRAGAGDRADQGSAGPGEVGDARATARGDSPATLGDPRDGGLVELREALSAGARSEPGRLIGVLAGSAHEAYPTGGWRLHAAVAARGAVVSEMPPGAQAQRWCFVARNRIIAALSAVTVVVQATERSGSLTTADFAAELGRVVGAVPGPVVSRLSGGVHALIQAGAPLVRGTEDVLELLAAETGRTFDMPAPPPVALAPRLGALLSAVEDGRGTLGELATTPEEARDVLAGLGELERLGFVRRGFGGRWERAA